MRARLKMSQNATQADLRSSGYAEDPIHPPVAAATTKAASPSSNSNDERSDSSDRDPAADQTVVESDDWKDCPGWIGIYAIASSHSGATLTNFAGQLWRCRKTRIMVGHKRN